MEDRVEDPPDTVNNGKLLFSLSSTESPAVRFMTYSKEQFVANRNQLARELLEDDENTKPVRFAQALVITTKVKKPSFFPVVSLFKNRIPNLELL